MKCDNCPLRDFPDRHCIYQDRNETRVCQQLINPNHPDYDPRYIAIILEAYPPPTPEPSLLQKAANFGRAITQHLAAGLPHADEVTVAHRLEVCRACENFDTERTACKVCGCSMQIKVRWAEQRCPVNKW